MAAERSGRVKGAVLRPMLEWTEQTFGAPALRTLAEGVPLGLADDLPVLAPSLGVVPTRWYSERLASALTDGVLGLAASTMSEDEALRAIGRVTVDASLNRISRALVAWFASPYASAMTAPVMWSLFHDTGTVSARVEGTSMFAICSSWVTHGANWCRVVGACATRVLEINGCIDPRLAAHTCTGGAGPCAMTLRWTRVAATEGASSA